MPSATWTNWSGWVTASPEALETPESEQALARAVAAATGPVRVAGSGHSFTRLCQTDGTLISLAGHSGIVSCDTGRAMATVKAGTSIRDLGPLLHEHGLGLVNQGDIDAQAIAGAVGTGTHGTGATLGCLSAAAAGFKLVTAGGEVLRCSADENADVFDAGRVSIGTLGVMSEITLQCRPAYVLKEQGGRMPASEVLGSLERLRDDNRHFEFFWFPFADEVLVKILNETDEPARPSKRLAPGQESSDDRSFRIASEIARAVPFARGPLQRFLTRASGSRYSGALAAPGRVRWSHEAFPSDRNVRFNEMEYAVPADKGPDCVQEVAEHMRTCGINFLFPIEFRYVAADDAWLSPFHGRASATIAVHQYHKQPYDRLFAGVEAIFRRYDGRPHWGKLHTRTAAELETVYPRWADFQAVRRRLDPQGKFLNPYLRELFGEA